VSIIILVTDNVGRQPTSAKGLWADNVGIPDTRADMSADKNNVKMTTDILGSQYRAVWRGPYVSRVRACMNAIKCGFSVVFIVMFIFVISVLLCWRPNDV